MLSVFDFSDASKISLSPLKFEFDQSLNSAIEAAWASEKERRGGALFNGKILSAIEISNTEIKAVIIEYKHYLAKKLNPARFSGLKINPIAVSGLLECNDGIVFGKRSNIVTQDAGNWELVPSGGLECVEMSPDIPIDFKGQLLLELKEEVGIDSSFVKNMKTFCYVLDEETFVLDIGISLFCDLDGNSITRAYSKLNEKEYDQLSFVKRDEIFDFVTEKSNQFVAVSKVLLNKYFGKTD